MRESILLEHIYARAVDLGGKILIGPGDDAAVVRIGEGDSASCLLLSTDQLVEGRHYEHQTPIDLIARKTVARSVSDIAAMGGTPVCALAAAAIRSEFDGADDLFDAMARWALGWGCPLVGGDIALTDGPTVLTTTVIGIPHAARGPALRSQARPGDLVCVTGALGGSLSSARHLSFEPRLAEAAWLCDELDDRLGAMIDLSDGLGLDAGRIAAASGVRIMLDAGRLPLAPTADGWPAALGDGEDYELCFTIAGECPRQTPTGVPITIVGEVAPGEGCVVNTPDAGLVDATGFGWDHHS